MDFLLMMAQGYQESRLDHSAKSHVGAIGVMQITPATGKELQVGDIRQLEPNVHGGVKYIRRFMIDTYFKGDDMDTLNKGLFAFASYNAGPGRIRSLRRETERRGLNLPMWICNHELLRWVGANSYRTAHYPYARAGSRSDGEAGFTA